MDTITPQINVMLARWGDRMPKPLSDEVQLAREYDYGLGLLATEPPDYQAGPLRVACDRIAQARRMYIWQAVTA